MGEKIPCALCGNPTPSMPKLETRRCYGCWELETRIRDNPDLAWEILHRVIDIEEIPSQRPATKTEIEAVGAICKLQDQLQIANHTIKELRRESRNG